QLVGLARSKVALTAVLGAIGAVAVARAASPLLPQGAARVAEPDPGFAVNVALLAAGFGAIVVALLAVAALPAWQVASARGSSLGTADVRGAGRPSRLSAGATRAGAPPSAAAGIRMALEPGRGRTAVPVRSAVVGLIVAG